MNSTKDIHIFESGSGGEMKILNGDLMLCESLLQVFYTSLFGGNVESSTQGNELEGQERFDYWANSLIFKQEKNKQFNSETEKILNTVALNSQGRIKIKSAVESDLEFLKNIVNLKTEVYIIADDKVEISIKASSVSGSGSIEYQFMYDNAKNEIIFNEVI